MATINLTFPESHLKINPRTQESENTRDEVIEQCQQINGLIDYPLSTPEEIDSFYQTKASLFHKLETLCETDMTSQDLVTQRLQFGIYSDIVEQRKEVTEVIDLCNRINYYTENCQILYAIPDERRKFYEDNARLFCALEKLCKGNEDLKHLATHHLHGMTYSDLKARTIEKLQQTGNDFEVFRKTFLQKMARLSQAEKSMGRKIQEYKERFDQIRIFKNIVFANKALSEDDIIHIKDLIMLQIKRFNVDAVYFTEEEKRQLFEIRKENIDLLQWGVNLAFPQITTVFSNVENPNQESNPEQPVGIHRNPSEEVSPELQKTDTILTKIITAFQEIPNWKILSASAITALSIALFLRRR